MSEPTILVIGDRPSPSTGTLAAALGIELRPFHSDIETALDRLIGPVDPTLHLNPGLLRGYP